MHQLNIIKITKKDYKNKACKRYQSLSKEEQEKSSNMVVGDI